ncbi:Hypothetical protein SRAE_1000005450 [Strongyloides ratti]|uniref:Uncharacterized protein n=1 Tax=Strongyloides ratti TaxID=34506 RepID=A0A090MTU9_STRRB|nr:Hypothetical protein SRAE_1000005450 [Strongyloides ratti]CEF61778.1 Hypothetical protein SRAE_1000005450 [Strongyloides ratti]
MVTALLQISFIIILLFFTIIIHSCFVWNPFICRWEILCPILTSTTTTTTTTIFKITTSKSLERDTTIFSPTLETTSRIPFNITKICNVITSVVTSGLVPIYKYYDFWSQYCCKKC